MFGLFDIFTFNFVNKGPLLFHSKNYINFFKKITFLLF